MGGDLVYGDWRHWLGDEGHTLQANLGERDRTRHGAMG
jgi:hypothetical protein